MIRTLSAAAALSLLAAPTAFAADQTVKLTGKTPAAAYASIVRAAKKACYAPGDDVYLVHLHDSCVVDTVEATIAKIANPELTQYATARKQLLLAKL